MHITPRRPGATQPELSPFITGSAFDPQTGQLRTFEDLQRRKLDLEAIVCATPPATNLVKGIERVH